MSETPSILTPLIAQLGVGGIGGLCVGYAIKKVAKIVAVLIGLFFLGLQYLAWKGIIDVNYGALEQWGANALGGAVAAEGVLATMIANLPFAASFGVGFALGIKIG
ncbi:FUN14 domain-containing protein [Candidatus Bathyarchaeota archaeon]|nr:FUN14 domain-containing protein [Candidatus Bathyarchaeota archaeon]